MNLPLFLGTNSEYDISMLCIYANIKKGELVHMFLSIAAVLYVE